MIRTNEFSKKIIGNMTSSPCLEKEHFLGHPLCITSLNTRRLKLPPYQEPFVRKLETKFQKSYNECDKMFRVRKAQWVANKVIQEDKHKKGIPELLRNLYPEYCPC